MTRITLQYFFIRAKSFSISFLPNGSAHFLEYLVNAFFFDLYLYFETREMRRQSRQNCIQERRL
jgi:hypothetical protein